MKYTLEQLEQIKSALTLMNGNKVFVPLKPEPLSRMAWTWRTRFMYFSDKVETLEETIAELVKFHNDAHMCGCMGARGDSPWCPCSLWAMMQIYKIDIAMEILKSHREITTVEEMKEHCELAYR